MKTVRKLIAVCALLIAPAALADKQAEPELEGYCPVAYIDANKAIEGKPEHSANYKGKVYHFVNDEALQAFRKDPEKYLPEYAGWCAYGMAFGKKVEIDPEVFTVVDGKLYLNKNRAIGEKFEEDPQGWIAKADEEWKKLNM